MHFTGLLLALSIVSQAPKPPPHAPLNAPPVVDSSPTAWSCTVDTLMSGKDCVFESEAAPPPDTSAQEKENVRFVRDQLGPSACGRAVSGGRKKGDAKLTDMCQREFAAVAETCGLGGAAPLVDAKGRFAPSARSCYLALADVLQRASFAAATTSQCCQCLAASCKVAADKCYRDLARAVPDSSEQACINGACSEECAAFPTRGPAPSGDQEATAPVPSLPKRPVTRHASQQL